MRQTIKYALILFLITGICVGILGAVNQITAPIIEVNDKKTEEKAMKQLLPASESFEEVSDIEDALVDKVFVAKSGNEIVGYVVRVTPTGYGGDITMLVGVDSQNIVKGISILSHAETPGFGANATKDSFTNQFVDTNAPLTVTKSASLDDEIQAITGATITSNAVVEGVNGACEYIINHKEEWGA